MSIYDKPYKSIDELLDILATRHHLMIEDKDTAKNILKFVPYYDLINGYKDCFMDDADFSLRLHNFINTEIGRE